LQRARRRREFMAATEVHNGLSHGLRVRVGVVVVGCGGVLLVIVVVGGGGGAVV